MRKTSNGVISPRLHWTWLGSEPVCAETTKTKVRADLQYLSNLTANSAHTKAAAAGINQTCSRGKVRSYLLPGVYCGYAAVPWRLCRRPPSEKSDSSAAPPRTSEQQAGPPSSSSPPPQDQRPLSEGDTQSDFRRSFIHATCPTGEGYLTVRAGGWCGNISRRPGRPEGQTGSRQVGKEEVQQCWSVPAQSQQDIPPLQDSGSTNHSRAPLLTLDLPAESSAVFAPAVLYWRTLRM